MGRLDPTKERELTMLLKFAGLREEPRKGRSFDVWVDAASIRTVRHKEREFYVSSRPEDKINCIFLGFQDGYLFLCPEMHPLESMEELVKLINQAKRKS